MTRSPRFWLAIAVVFLLVNVAGGVYALAMEEPLHGLTHFLLLIPGGYWLSRLLRKRRATPTVRLDPDTADNRLQRIEQAVEAVAIEVERVGEGQRFITRVLTKSGSSVTSPQEQPASRPAGINPE